MPVLYNGAISYLSITFEEGLRCILLVDSLHELSDDQRDTLDPLDLFLSSHQLSL